MTLSAKQFTEFFESREFAIANAESMIKTIGQGSYVDSARISDIRDSQDRARSELLDAIKKAVDQGLTVHAGNDSYVVSRDSAGLYIVTYTPNGDCVGLHGMERTQYANRLNASGFYAKEGVA